MLCIYRHSVTVDGDGQYDNTSDETFVGEFLGLKIRYGTFTTGTVQISGFAGDLSRILYAAADPTETKFQRIRRTTMDASGSGIAIAGEYGDYCLSGDAIRIQIVGGVAAQTIHFELLFDISYKQI